MFCALSGEVPTEPVVSKTGHVFERRLIEKHLAATGKCPVTEQPLTSDDLIPLNINKAIKPRAPSATSVPGMIQLFQNEWDALMLETYTLKQHLDTVRQELSHALYQHDAACRVIARLRKERDEARTALANTSANLSVAVSNGRVGGGGMEVEEQKSSASGTGEALGGLSESLIEKMQATAKELSKTRKTRAKNPPPTLATPSQLAALTELSSHRLHSSSKPGVLTVDLHPDQNQTLTGGVDGVAVLFNRATGKIIEKLEGHKKRINSVKFHPTRDIVFTASQDHTANIWVRDGAKYGVGHTITTHTADVVGCSLHPTGDLLVTASADRTWALHNVNSGITHIQVRSDDNPVYSAVSFHPDGLILGTGSADRTVRVFDVQNQKNVANFVHETGAIISALAFSENGYFMASADDGGTVKLWDLRKLKNFRTIAPPAGGAAGSFTVRGLDFDYSGQYLAIAGTDLRVYSVKDFNLIKVVEDYKEPATGVKWGADARFLAVSSLDRTLKFFGAGAGSAEADGTPTGEED